MELQKTKVTLDKHACHRHRHLAETDVLIVLNDIIRDANNGQLTALSPAW